MYKKAILSSIKICVVSIFLTLTVFFAFGTVTTGTLFSISLVSAASELTNINSVPGTHALSSQKTGVNGNPWGYDFVRGLTIKKVPANFCHYFRCIANFFKGRGYVMECHDATYSLSGGISGSCSHHKGNWRILYRH